MSFQTYFGESLTYLSPFKMRNFIINLTTKLLSLSYEIEIKSYFKNHIFNFKTNSFANEFILTKIIQCLNFHLTIFFSKPFSNFENQNFPY
jgi:hypothetical protein